MSGLLFRLCTSASAAARGFSAGRPKPVVGAQPPPRDQRNPSCGNCVFDVRRKSSKNRGMSKTIVEAYPRKRACLRTRAAHWKSSHPEDRTPYMLLQEGSAKMTQHKLSDDTMFQTGSHSIFSSGGGEVDVLGHLLTTIKPPHTVARAYNAHVFADGDGLFRRALFFGRSGKGVSCATQPAQSRTTPKPHRSRLLSTQRNVPTA